MQVVSGPVGARVIHVEASPAACVDAEMEAFLAWFEAPSNLAPLVHAAIAHLRFVTIHPFSDGNGRIGRAIADLGLARATTGCAVRVSLSRQIRKERFEKKIIFASDGKARKTSSRLSDAGGGLIGSMLTV